MTGSNIGRSLLALAALVITMAGTAQALGQHSEASQVQPQLQPQKFGLIVTWVIPRAPADRAGIRNGDVILEVDDARIQNLRDLWQALRNADGDVEIVLTDRRADARRTVRVNPDRSGRIGVYAEPYVLLRPGRERYAVEVTYVYPGSPAAWAGLERGDVITRVDGRRTDSFDDLRDALRDARGGARLDVINVRTGRLVSIYVYPTADNRIGIDAELTTVSLPDRARWEY